ncbi:glycoside hydrolase family 9 protein [Pseudobacteroides cellulosolvens]|uniref:Cellulose 1,4-beta-cellobiosidase n=1 Tax=Pseudobacteroides cellulosolvens ATCC 35603 = DSM 2933 TaxID=398512 RepID=A0A0L6JIS7_9FIRM|nr:glycoside hydrolase family 9 protein [Pseudobacteroides cellulosolvens]KNY25649.1 Cellulose 1,4-beta-cellobiosidase [Pseudobacteroides cellulosolvens ATCC 35603 = DSM 2933]
MGCDGWKPVSFTLEKGRTYSVTFDVYSEIAQDLKFQIVDSADKQILIKSVSVQANTTKTFTFENDFEVSDTCQAKWAFQVGGYGTAGETYKIMIDNIKIMHPDLTVTVEKEDPLANMVKNPGFEQGIKNWGIYTMVGGSATFNASSGEGRLNIKNTGTEDYAVQFFQDGMKLYKGNKYKLKFRYKADTERSAEVRIQQNGGTYIGYLDDKSLTFKNDWQTYEKEFTMDYDSDTAARLCFNLGKAGTASDVNQNICFDDFSLVMTQGSLPEEQKANPIRLNQVGYRPDDSKVAFVVSQDRTFKLYTADDKLFMTGNLPVYKADEKGEVLVDEKSGDITRSADFTNFNLEGSFYIKVRADKSPVFKIEPNVYDGLTAGVLKVFYYQRCGGNGITEEYAGEKFAHDPCHTGKAKYYDPTNEIYGSVEIDVSGGWHDAGDYGRYVTPASKAVADLLLTAEHFPAMADLDFGGPDKILAETRYEIEWMLKMQNPITGGVYHKVTTKNHASMTALPEADKDQLYLSPVSAQATADFAAVMAYAYRMYNKIDPAFAQECMVAAKKAWEWLTANPDANAYVDPSFFGTGTYNDGNAKDELFWAAAELFKTTKEEKYLDYLTSYVAGKSNLDNGFGWADMGSYAQVAYLTTESVDKNDELYKKIKQNFIDHAASIIETWKKDGYKVALDDYVWGSNKDLSDRAMILIIANMLEEKHEYKAAVLDQLNYLLGRNAMDISYVTGYGEKAAKHPHHRQSVINEQAVPGMLVGGPNGYIMDVNGDPVAKMVDEKTPPAKCYADVDGSYATNEICIYWNSPLVYILGYLYQK